MHANTFMLGHFNLALRYPEKLRSCFYVLQAGYTMCSAGWLAQNRVAYPMSYSNPKCGFGHVGIVDYGTQTDLSKTWDTFCYRVKGMFMWHPVFKI